MAEFSKSLSYETLTATDLVSGIPDTVTLIGAGLTFADSWERAV